MNFSNSSFIRIWQFEEVGIAVLPAVCDERDVEVVKRAHEVDVADHLALLPVQAEQVDHSLLDRLIHGGEASLVVEVCL